MRCRVIILGNALDDATRIERGISTDSPAAARKIFMLARLLRSTRVRAVVVSLGRGRQDGSGRLYSRSVRRVGGAPVVYLRFLNLPILSKLLSAVEPIALLWRGRKRARSSTVVFYNRMAGYIPTLVAASILGYRKVLDLEDGEVGLAPFSAAGLGAHISRRVFDRLCNGGALLACSALAEMTGLSPTLCYYGTVGDSKPGVTWGADVVTVLLGGTLAPSTGAPLLAAAIRMARAERSDVWRRMRFVVCGYGESAGDFRALAASDASPSVQFLGRTTDAQYRSELERAQVGLALKPAGGILANSTFPSKVIELAGAGVLVVTTDISDVRQVLGTGALYLADERAEGLAEILRWIAVNPTHAESLALKGMSAVNDACAPAVIGPRVSAFVCGRMA